MSKTLRAGASALPFAHLLGQGPRAGKRAEEEDRREDEDKKDGTKAEGQDQDESDDKKDKEGDGKKADGGSPYDEGKKGKAEGDDNDKDKDKDDERAEEEDDEDEDVRAAAAAGRRAERARCRKIFSVKSAGARPDMAAQLAFGTDLTSAEAIALLDTIAVGGAASAGGKGGEFYAAMAGRRPPNPGVSAGGDKAGEPSFAEQMQAAVGKVRPAK